jgi:hypothetical protein
MKRVTFEIDEALLAKAEQWAAMRGLTVDELVADLVAKVTGGETPEAYRARMEMVEMARRPDIPRRVIPWTREELYERGVSGHERDRLRGHGPDTDTGEVGDGGGNHAE